MESFVTPMTRAVATDSPMAASTVASTVENSTAHDSTAHDSTAHDSTAHDVAVTSAGDDLEGIQGRVGRVGDPASVGGDLAQRR
jgi:hypothetical protein